MKLKSAILSDKLYFKKEDLVNTTIESVQANFNYLAGDVYISTLQSIDEEIYSLPTNAYTKFSIEKLIDGRTWEVLDKKFEVTSKLYPNQQEAVEEFFVNDELQSGILVAKCSWGKTYTGCALIGRANVRTLILVHTKLLFNQWYEELKKQIPNATIGRVGDNIFELGDIVVAIYKSAITKLLPEYKDYFSLSIVDEAHLCPANLFSQVVNNFSSKVNIGITATPKRKDGKEAVFDDYFTDFRVYGKEIPTELPKTVIRVVPTDISFFLRDPKRDWTKAINALYLKPNFVEMITELMLKYIAEDRCPLLLADRVEFLRSIQKNIPSLGLMIGATLAPERDRILKQAGKDVKGILSTKLFDEGISCHRLDTLILTAPTSNFTKMEQRIGRIEREHIDKQFPLVVDVWYRGSIVERQQANKYNWYTTVRDYDVRM